MCLPFYGNDTAAAATDAVATVRPPWGQRRGWGQGAREEGREGGRRRAGVLRQRDNPPEGHTRGQGEREEGGRRERRKERRTHREQSERGELWRDLAL